MDKIRTGLAAYGMSGRVFHAPFISTNPHFELTAVTERSKELSGKSIPTLVLCGVLRNLSDWKGWIWLSSTHRTALIMSMPAAPSKLASMWLWRSLSLPPWQKLRSWWHLPQAGADLERLPESPVGRRFSDGQGNTVQRPAGTSGGV